MQRNKQYTEEWNLFLILIILWAMLAHLVGCMSDRTALQKVLTKQPLFDTVGQVYTQLHPCNPITIVHHSDTSYLHDTAIVSTTDTIGNYIHDTTIKTIRLYTKIHDRDTIVDGQQIAILKSQIDNYKQQIAALNQAVTTANLSTVQEHSRGNGWELKFWLLLAAIVAVVLLLILKPKL
ncbi:hypothetical protein UFOVP129_13 [uncultured Caudovirales phage]|uniref:Uncharacterized protein n=1 Tax=uncultured Caudovirales phage TaxID=2100421 RepID=A0A6J5LCH5_9CAUD|nr:hypothetical protein UFOVP129_13 [uncultured Caudovirales phage]